MDSFIYAQIHAYIKNTQNYRKQLRQPPSLPPQLSVILSSPPSSSSAVARTQMFFI